MDHIGVGIIVPLVLVWGWWTTISLDRRLRSVERNVSALLRHFNVDPTVQASPSEQVKLLAADPARRVEAIRVYRQETGADLMSAKVIVDELAKSS